MFGSKGDLLVPTLCPTSSVSFIEAVLIKNGLWDYAIGASIRPDTGSSDEKNCIQKDQKALADLKLAINTSELYCVKQCTTSKDVWNKKFMNLKALLRGPSYWKLYYANPKWIV